MNVSNKKREDDFLNEVSKRIVLFMKSHNISFFAIFSTNVIELITKTSSLYDMICWNKKIEICNEMWYESINHILREENDNDSYKYPEKLVFKYNSVKWRITKYYLLHKITWGGKNVTN